MNLNLSVSGAAQEYNITVLLSDQIQASRSYNFVWNLRDKWKIVAFREAFAGKQW